MLSYIYIVLQNTADGKTEVITGSGKKYEITRYFNSLIEAGLPISYYEVVRMKPNQPSTVTYIDVYDFMEFDMGEVE